MNKINLYILIFTLLFINYSAATNNKTTSKEPLIKQVIQTAKKPFVIKARLLQANNIYTNKDLIIDNLTHSIIVTGNKVFLEKATKDIKLLDTTTLIKVNFVIVETSRKQIEQLISYYLPQQQRTSIYLIMNKMQQEGLLEIMSQQYRVLLNNEVNNFEIFRKPSFSHPPKGDYAYQTLTSFVKVTLMPKNKIDLTIQGDLIKKRYNDDYVLSSQSINKHIVVNMNDFFLLIPLTQYKENEKNDLYTFVQIEIL